MPENTIYVGRPTKFGNPYKVGEDRLGFTPETMEETIFHFELCIGSTPMHEINLADVRELKGKNLACWCPLDKPCHADVLLKLANESEIL